MKINDVRQRCTNTAVIMIILSIYERHFINIDYTMQYNYEKFFGGRNKNYMQYVNT